jgi:hypothetical protein
LTEKNITRIRRGNMHALYQEFAAGQLAAGESAKGLEQAFAARLEISPARWSQIKSAFPISDKLARQLEHHLEKPAGWLDAPRDFGPDPNEEEFIEMARAAWRASNAVGRRELKGFVKARVPKKTGADVA